MDFTEPPRAHMLILCPLVLNVAGQWVCMHVLASMASTPVSCELLEAAGACKEVAKFMALYAKDG